MINITEKDLELLAKILASKKDTVRKLLIDMFPNGRVLKHSIVVGDNCKGNIALVSHYDTVHNDREDRELIWDKEKGIFWSPDGLGADDRAGVWANIMIYKHCKENNLPIPVLVFTDLEEKGGIGAEEVALEYSEELSKLNFFIEIDRKGYREAVFYNNETEEFKNFILEFGFTEERGSFSDITTLGLATDLCSVNLSAGYYNQHTKTEHLRLNHLLYTMNKVIEIIQVNKKQNKQYKLPDYLKITSSTHSLYHTSYYDDYYDNYYDDMYYSFYNENQNRPAYYENCFCCQRIVNTVEEDYYIDDMDGVICENCAKMYCPEDSPYLTHIKNNKKKEKKKERKMVEKTVKFDKEGKRKERKLKILKKQYPDDFPVQEEVIRKSEGTKIDKMLKIAIASGFSLSLEDIMKQVGLKPAKFKYKTKLNKYFHL